MPKVFSSFDGLNPLFVQILVIKFRVLLIFSAFQRKEIGWKCNLVCESLFETSCDPIYFVSI